MNPGLRYLLMSRLPGALRRLRRIYSGREGKILLLGVALLFALILASQATFAKLSPDSKISSMRPTPDGIRLYAPSILLLVALVGIRPGAFYFKAAEVQFLFPAPIPRLQLLVFNILARLQIVLLSTLWVSFFTVRSAATWYGGVLAVFMLLCFNQFTAQLGGVWLAGFDPSPAARKRRWGAVTIVAIGVAAAVVATFPRAPTGLADAATLLIEHPFVVTLSWITRPFVELFLAASPADLLLYGGIAAAILGAELFAMARIDHSYLEGLAGHGRVTGRRSKKVRLAVHRDPSAAVKSGRGIRIPSRLFPHLAGAGPLAWRQAQELLRNPGKLLRGGLGLFAVVPVLVIRASAAEQDALSLGAGSVVTALLMIPMMVDGADFRRDLDRMSLLRSLPMSAPALVLGQLLPTAILIGFWMWIGSLMVLVIIDLWRLPIVALLALTIPPLAFITTAVDNWLYLLMPYRMRTQDPGEATFVGRLTVVMTIKMVVMLLAVAISVAVAFAFWNGVAESVYLVGVVFSLTLVACCVPLTFAVAHTFQKFDVAERAAE